jgi:hypothetical protein
VSRLLLGLLASVQAAVDTEPSDDVVLMFYGNIARSVQAVAGGDVLYEIVDVQPHEARSPLASTVRRNAPSPRSASGHALWMADQMVEARKASAARRVMADMASPVLR